MENIQYVFNLNKLKEFDIILLRTDDDLCKKMNSDFNHAMLYLGRGSFLDADYGNGVAAQNLQRIGFSTPEHAVVLRTKHEIPDVMRLMISISARRIVGMEYDVREALLVKKGRDGKHQYDRQFCTRYVAQVYDSISVKIVENPNYCTPQEILNSKILQRVPDYYRGVTQFDLDIINEKKDIIEDQTAINAKIMSNCRGILGKDIQSLEQAFMELIKQPEKDTAMTQMLNESGFLDLYDQMYTADSWLLNKQSFREKFKDDLLLLNGINQLRADATHNGRMYYFNYISLSEIYNRYPLDFIKKHMDLYKKLVDTCNRQIEMVNEIDLEFEEEVKKDPTRFDLLMQRIAEANQGI